MYDGGVGRFVLTLIVAAALLVGVAVVVGTLAYFVSGLFY